MPSAAYSQEQKVKINLPAYELTLETIMDGTTTELKYPITIGKGYGTKPQTPVGQGYIVEKRGEVTFTFSDGRKIYWNRTFDDNGKPYGHNLQYPELRGLGMLIKDARTSQLFDRYVIHSNVDEFTLSAATSHGCVRVGVDEMKELFDAVQPEQKMSRPNEMLQNPVPVEIVYDILELKGNQLVLHEDIYHFGIDPVEEFKSTVGAVGYNLAIFDYDKIRKELTEAQTELHKAHEEILSLLSNDYPKNYINPELKARLHKKYNLEEFLKK